MDLEIHHLLVHQDPSLLVILDIQILGNLELLETLGNLELLASP
jgi:hypothetical protein